MSYTFRVSIFIVGLITLILPDALYAQNPTDPQIFAYNVRKSPTVGLKGGVLLSTITGDEAIDEFAKKMGPQIGITGAMYFHPKLSIRGELNYEAKGGKFANHEMKMNLNYASLPIYLKFNFIRDPEIYIYGGGYASYLLTAKTEGTYQRLEIIEEIDEDISPNLNKLDAGIVAGLGVQGRFNRHLDIFIDLRYTQGFINLDNRTADIRYNFNYDEFWPEQEVDKPKNKGVILSVGFIIYLIPR